MYDVDYGAGSGPNGIDIKVSKHHMVSISNFESIKVLIGGIK